MKPLQSSAVIILFIVAMMQPSFSGAAEVSLIADSVQSPMSPSIYFTTLDPYRGYFRVSLYEYWGMYGMYLEEIRYDVIEGLPWVRSSYTITAEDLQRALQLEYIWGYEFIDWLDDRSFEIGFNDDQSFTLQRIGKGEYSIVYE